MIVFSHGVCAATATPFLFSVMKQWSFTTIQHGPRKSLGLDLNEYAVLDLIYKDQTYPSSGGVSRLSVQQIADILGLSKGGVHGLIQRMIESQFVEMMPDVARKATPKFYETAYFDRSENERQRSESERNRSENERVYKEVSKVSKVNKSIVGKPDDAEKITPIVVGAITLLNELTKSAFKPSSKKTRDTIKARVNEGANLEDFEKVIRHKVAAWLNDPKQSQYLRPETLFGPKFEGYLQCANRAAQINAIESLIDIELSEDQGSLYLDYYQYTRDHYPRLFATTRIIPASEYFALKPGGKRHRGLSLKWSPGDLKSIFKTTHDEAAKLVDTGKTCPELIELLNQKLSK